MAIHTLGDLEFILTKEYPAVDPDILDSIVNERYKQCLIADGYVWSRLEVDDAPLELVGQYNTGLVTVTQGSPTVTGDGTNAWTTALDQRSIRIASRDEFYTLTFNNSNQLTLDRAYEGASAAGVSYSIFQRVYELAPDAQEVRNFRVLQINSEMDKWSRRDLDKVAPSRIEVSLPRIWVPYADTSDGTAQVEIYPTPLTAMGLTYDYKTAKSELRQPDDAIPSWFPWHALLTGCRVDLSVRATAISNRTTGIWAARQEQVNEQKFAAQLAAAISEDINNKPPQQIMMAERLNAYRRGRQFSDRALHWWELHISNQ